MLSENFLQQTFSPMSDVGAENFDSFCDKMTTTPSSLHGAAQVNNTRQTSGPPTLQNTAQSPTTAPIQLTIPTFRRPLTDTFNHRPMKRHSSKTRTKTKKAAQCVVCGERASGMYFGALVCLPCKSFFIRCTKDGKPQLTCLGDKSCSIDRSNRMRCQYCRYKKCLTSGMRRREKPETVEPGEGQELCKVCADIANGIHFGVMTCEGCKKFFRRALKEADTYDCKHLKICTLNPRNRNACRYCRYRKCIDVGMSRQAIRMGRPKKVKAENEGLYAGYGAFDCYYSQTPAVAYGSTMAQPPHRQFPPALTMSQLSPPPQNSRYRDLSCSDDSGIESDAANSPLTLSHSPPLSATTTTTIKSEPQDFFGPCSGGNMCYSENKIVGNSSHMPMAAAASAKDVDMKNGTVDLEDLFFSEPIELDTEDMNDVLATLGQFLGSMGQTTPMNSNTTTATGCHGYSNLTTTTPQRGVLSEKSPLTFAQQSNLLPSISKTYQGTLYTQDSFQQGFTPEMLPYGCYKQWQSAQQCSQPYFCGDQSSIPQRPGTFPCYSF